MRFSILSLAAALSSVSAQTIPVLSTYSWYTDVPYSYQCLLTKMPDFDVSHLIASPSEFISALERRPATYYAGLVGMTTGCAFETAPTAAPTPSSAPVKRCAVKTSNSA